MVIIRIFKPEQKIALKMATRIFYRDALRSLIEFL